jgi:hypothetical protein
VASGGTTVLWRQCRQWQIEISISKLCYEGKIKLESLTCLLMFIYTLVISFPFIVQQITWERGSEPIFSGLYAYHIPTNTWKLVMDDSTELRSRIGHSMLFHPVCT